MPSIEWMRPNQLAGAPRGRKPWDCQPGTPEPLPHTQGRKPAAAAHQDLRNIQTWRAACEGACWVTAGALRTLTGHGRTPACTCACTPTSCMLIASTISNSIGSHPRHSGQEWQSMGGHSCASTWPTMLLSTLLHAQQHDVMICNYAGGHNKVWQFHPVNLNLLAVASRCCLPRSHLHVKLQQHSGCSTNAFV
jgi:hypothetical protein